MGGRRRSDLHPDVEVMLSALESFPDVTRHEAAELREIIRLAEAGVPVTAHRFDGLFHGFLTFSEPLADRTGAGTGVADDARRIGALLFHRFSTDPLSH